MVLQSCIFYDVAFYGGVEESLDNNAIAILNEKLTNRRNELETQFTNKWTKLSAYEDTLDSLYAEYEKKPGKTSFASSKKEQVDFLSESSDTLFKMLRDTGVNGVFLILNDEESAVDDVVNFPDNKYGICIRDMDVESAYTNRSDLLIERAPSSLVDKMKCSLDSWWEADYTFASRQEGAYFYNPIREAWKNPDVKGEDLAYFCGAHRLSDTDQEVVSYSIPLFSQDGKPYGVLGIELTTKYLASLLPKDEINDADESCYVLALHNVNEKKYMPITSSGVLYNRCFSAGQSITYEEEHDDGFELTGRGDVRIYGQDAALDIYNNNNPFEDDELTLVAMVNRDTLFAYSHRVKYTLIYAAVFSLFIGIMGILLASHRFAKPITNLAKRARKVKSQEEYNLGHLGISEIDQLVDSIEYLSQNVSKEIARTDFFSRMSHDMRTPMNAIISFSSEEMLEGADENKKDEYIQKIHTSGTYLLGLINEVLDMTKIESNKVDLNYSVVQADKLCDAIEPMIDKLAQEKNISFYKNKIVDEHLYIKADIQHVEQIVINLLSNAVKFTPQSGNIYYTLCMQKKDVNKHGDEELDTGTVLCHIQIRDTGSGMSEEFMKKLYTPFEQERPGNGGTGLGLSICKKLVELMGGSISCSSQINEGTTFDVYIPFVVTQEDTQETADSQDKDKELDDEILQGRCVLLCEDHEMNMQIARRLLERKGIIVETAQNGQIGVDTFIKSDIGHFDAILMDIRMPVLDGLETAKRIRHLSRSDAKSVPIIAMTANAFEDDIRMSRKAGMNAHLSKPIEPDKLYKTLAEKIKAVRKR